MPTTTTTTTTDNYFTPCACVWGNKKWSIPSVCVCLFYLPAWLGALYSASHLLSKHLIDFSGFHSYGNKPNIRYICLPRSKRDSADSTTSGGLVAACNIPWTLENLMPKSCALVAWYAVAFNCYVVLLTCLLSWFYFLEVVRLRQASLGHYHMTMLVCVVYRRLLTSFLVFYRMW